MIGTIKLYDKCHGFGFIVGENGKEYYTKINGLIAIRLSLICVFFFYCFVANAQLRYSWGDCVQWFKNEGHEFLAVYAHPTSDVNDYSITLSGDDIIVEYDFEGFLSNYTARYKILHGYNSNYNLHYIKDVVILKDEDPYPPFRAWGRGPKLHPEMYSRAELHRLYGYSGFDNIPVNRTKAAVALMMEFIGKWFQ